VQRQERATERCEGREICYFVRRGCACMQGEKEKKERKNKDRRRDPINPTQEISSAEEAAQHAMHAPWIQLFKLDFHLV